MLGLEQQHQTPTNHTRNMLWDTTKRTEPDTVPGGYPPGAEPFLSAIIADREDDTPRLVFADWLQENGDEDRAEFIRLQIELARRHPDYADEQVRQATFSTDDYAHYERQRLLLAQNRTVWLARFPRWAISICWQSFHRGFPTAIHANSDQWFQQGEFLRRWLPLEEVRVEGGRAVLLPLIENSSLRGLRKLTLRGLGTAELRALVDSPILATVVNLHLSGSQPHSVEAVHDLFRSHNLKELRELRVWFDSAGDVGFAIADSAHLRSLRVLTLAGGLQTEAARALFNSPNLANVTHLDLGNNPLGDEAIRGLVQSAHATRLNKLVLRATRLTAESGRLLAAWPGLVEISELDLSANALGLDGIQALSESPYLRKLEQLLLRWDLHSNQVSLARALPGFASIRRLDVG